jgi:ankyrin repeat protein
LRADGPFAATRVHRVKGVPSPTMTADWQRALEAGDVDALSALLAKGADVNARDRYGQTSLMVAVIHGRLEVVRWLITGGAHLDHTAKFGLSALMLAVVRGETAIAETLAGAGADLTVRGTGAPGFAGRTACDLARARGDLALAERLRV